MTHAEQIEREIADMKYQIKTLGQEETKPKRSGFFGLIGAFIIGFIVGILMGYLLLA